MAAETQTENYLELFDVAKKEQVGKVPLSLIRFIPRTGERLFLPSSAPGKWAAYTVVAVEYFLSHGAAGSQPSVPVGDGAHGRITLFVEESK